MIYLIIVNNRPKEKIVSNADNCLALLEAKYKGVFMICSTLNRDPMHEVVLHNLYSSLKLR